MSRLGEKPIEIPEGAEVNIKDGVICVKGPKGELKRDFKDVVDIKVRERSVILALKKKNPQARALWGTYASHIRNMIEGVTKGYVKSLIVEGIGYKTQIEGSNLVLNLGFSHPVKMPIPDEVEIKTEKNRISITGINKELVGQVSATIRAFKKPEPYKGKGIRYENEIIRRKAGKKAVSAT